MVLRKADSRDSGQSGEREEWTSSSGDIWALWGKKRSITPPPDSHRAPPSPSQDSVPVGETSVN